MARLALKNVFERRENAGEFLWTFLLFRAIA
jgi:hypothetical protein